MFEKAFFTLVGRSGPDALVSFEDTLNSGSDVSHEVGDCRCTTDYGEVNHLSMTS